MIRKVSEAEFNQEIKKDKLLLVDFFATWCGPCQMMEPVIEELAEDYKKKENFEILQVDIDQENVLAAKYNVMSVPTFLLIKNGKVLEKMIGARPKDIFEEAIEKVFL